MNIMEADHQAHLAFYLTGARAAGALHAIEELKLRPALFSAYRDLSALRYDFPLVLLRKDSDAPYASLSSIIDRLAGKLAPAGVEGDRLRKRLLQLEREIRRLAANGANATLLKLWNIAAGRLAGSDDALAQAFNKARAALDCDGLIADCNPTMPARLFVRAWRFVQDEKARRFRSDADRMILKLSDILRADFAGSAAGRDPQHLKASVGTTYEDAFDFDAMSTVIARASSGTGLSQSRRRRIENALSALESQKFFPAAHARDKHAAEPYSFVFANCADVEEAFRERMPKIIEVAKAMAIAELEIKGEYNEAKHDALFEAFGQGGLTAEEWAPFPNYLLCMYAGEPDEFGQLMALLAANLPVKVLVQFDDLLEASPFGDGQVALSFRSKQLADMAIGLNNVYALQSAASNLVQMRERVLKGLSYDGAALFSVYSGTLEESGLPPYLVAAAAMEARAFPAFVYDPSAGSDWASRFTVAENPQAERDWPAQLFSYEDAEHQTIAQELDFTLVDFMACDARYARHFAKVPPAKWNGDMVTVREWLSRKTEGLPSEVPYLMMIDDDDVLQRVIVDVRLIQEAQRCREVWHSLQELGGIHNSHAERLLAREKQTWDEEKQREIEALKRDAKPTADVVQQPVVPGEKPAVVATAPAEAVEEKRSDDPNIETPRCTTCEECIQVNNKMFVYDANKQAYIADLAAGTYRQLVEAAESCQVSIIHPGKPRNSGEPGLEDLLERAQPFL